MTKAKQRPQTTSIRVKPDRLKTNTDAFQFRSFDYDHGHVSALVDAINRGDELDQMVVWRDPDDAELYVLSGHHRLKAYRQTGRTAALRVQLFEGTFKDAQMQAFASNRKVVLNQTSEERQDGAWRLVCEVTDKGAYVYSVAETAKAAGICKSQVSNMRKVRATLTQMDEALPKSWLAARLAAKGRDQFDSLTDDDRNALLEAQIAALDAKIGNALTEAGHRSPEALGHLLSRRLGRRGHVVASFCHSVGVFDDDEEEDCPF